MKFLYLLLFSLFGFLLFLSTLDFPKWADPHQPASRHVSPRYIEKSLEETGVPNVVTAVLADYRGYDTLFETSVIFTAAAVVILLLGGSNGGQRRKHSG